MTRAELTEKILAHKVLTGFTWSDVAEKVGKSKEWTACACMGQLSLSKEQAEAAGNAMGLNFSDDEMALLASPHSPSGADSRASFTDGRAGYAGALSSLPGARKLAPRPSPRGSGCAGVSQQYEMEMMGSPSTTEASLRARRVPVSQQ